MSRYVKKIEVKDPKALTDPIAVFLQQNGMELGGDRSETFWWKRGTECTQHIMLHSGEDYIVITAFIRYIDLILGTHHEKTINGFIAAFGKWPLKRIVKRLEKFIKQSQPKKEK